MDKNTNILLKDVQILQGWDNWKTIMTIRVGGE